MTPRILIADDHEIVRKGIRALVESCRNVQVLEASDGKEAVEKTIESKPDLVILDVSMPRLDGFSAAREIKRVASGIPILILTFEKTEALAELARSIGVSAYLTKGEGGDALLRAIDVAIGNDTGESADSDGSLQAPVTLFQPNQHVRRSEDSRSPYGGLGSSPPLRLLLFHSDSGCIVRCLQELTDAQFQVEADVASSFEESSKYLTSKQYDVIMTEYPIPLTGANPTTDILRRADRQIPLILLTNKMERQAAADLIAEGASDCVEIDNLGQLRIAIRRAHRENKLHRQRNRAERQLQHSEAHYRALAGNLVFGICRCGTEGQFVDVNHALLAMLGYESKAELLGLNFAAGILDDSSTRSRLLGVPGENGRVDLLEMNWSRKDGTALKVRLSGREVYTPEGKQGGYEIIVHDVTKQLELEDDLRQQANRDPLTGLGNYRHLLGALESEVRRFKRTGREFAVILFDLDGLKQINDQHGHLTGSEALRRLASVLAAGCRNIDTAARYGGDEFAVVLTETGLEAAKAVAQRLCDDLANDGKSPHLTVSAGTAIYPENGEAIEALLLAADRALYGNKSTVHDKFRIAD
jgi:diguanylate cyclase (GGDEF)-like protein/PAS domain S-box-containing protein